MSLALLVLLGAGPACAAVKNPGTVVYAARSDIDSLDPAWAFDAASGHVIHNVYETLLHSPSGKPGDWAPLLAERMPEVSKDGLIYRFPLRQGVRFHDGSMLTPEDARYSFLRHLLTDRDGGGSALLLEPLLGVYSTRKDGALIPGIVERAFEAVTVDADALVVRLRKPFAPFLSILAGVPQIMSKSWCAANGQWDGRPESAARFNNAPESDYLAHGKMNGTGPFRLERYDAATKQVLLARHERYWRGPARLRSVVIRTIPEFGTRMLMLEAGDADVLEGMPAHLTQLRSLPGVDIVDGLIPLVSPSMLAFTRKLESSANPNIGSGRLDGAGIPPDFFGDKDVRLGFAYSIDYRAYAREVLRGRAPQAAGFLAEGFSGWDPARRPRYRFDPGKAAEHLRRAWGGRAWEKGFAFAIVTTASEPSLALAQMVKKNVEALNPRFQIEVRSIQWSSLLEQMRQRKIPITVRNWRADYPDSHNFAFPFAHSAGEYAQQHAYSLPGADELIERAVAELDPVKRAALYATLQDIVDEELPFVNVAQPASFHARRRWVTGYVFRPMFPGALGGGYYYDLSKSE